MFKHKMAESKDGVVEIKGVSAAVLREMLRFIYSGECTFADGKCATPYNISNDDIVRDSVAANGRDSGNHDGSGSGGGNGDGSGSVSGGGGGGQDASRVLKNGLQRGKRTYLTDKSEDALVNGKDDKTYSQTTHDAINTNGANDGKESDTDGCALGFAPVTGNLTIDLLAAADRFQIPELVSFCSDHLAACISPERAAELLEVANRFHLIKLKVFFNWVAQSVRSLCCTAYLAFLYRFVATTVPN